MSMTRKQVAEEKQLYEVIEAMEEDNVEKIKEAISTKKHGKGFVLSSKFAKKKKRPNSKGQKPQVPAVIGSPFGSPPLSRSPVSRGVHEKAYITEVDHVKSRHENKVKAKKVDMASQFEEPPTESIPEAPPGTPEPKPAPEEVGDVTPSHVEHKKEKAEEKVVGEKRKKKGRRISSASYARLALTQRPPEFKLQPKLPQGNPLNPEPAKSNVYITRVPKTGANIGTPFFAQLDIPKGALKSDAIVKFETQDYKGMQINLGRDDKICSHIIDINLAPTTHCLHTDAIVRMRILKECVNDYDDVIILATRHFEWQRVVTNVERKVVDGTDRFYAVTSTQFLGKFVVLTSPKVDRFVLTTAGDLIMSSIVPEVKIRINERSIGNINHLVELYVKKMRENALVNTGSCQVDGGNARLAAASPLISVTKHAMSRSPSLPLGVTLPHKVQVTVPMVTTSHQRRAQVWTKLKVFQKTEETWSDTTAEQDCLPTLSSIQSGASDLVVTATVPCHLMALVLSETEKARNIETTEICDELLENDGIYDVKILVHQKIESPEIISVHIVPKEAGVIISGAMEADGGWKKASEESNRAIRLAERDHVIMRHQGGLKLTINQISPEIQFNSRRWQGYEFQLEENEDSLVNKSDSTIGGALEFHRVADDITEESLLHHAYITVDRERAKPYKPTRVQKPTPKVQVFREYKLKWMKNLSPSEKEKYKSINTP